MTIESKIRSAQIAALNDGYLIVDRTIVLHYLELSLHELNLQHAPLSDIDRKELTKAVKILRKRESVIPIIQRSPSGIIYRSPDQD